MKLGDICREYTQQPGHDFIEVCENGLLCRVTDNGVERRCAPQLIIEVAGVAATTPTPSNPHQYHGAHDHRQCDPDAPGFCGRGKSCAKSRDGWRCGHIQNSHMAEPFPVNVHPIATYVPTPGNLNPLPSSSSATKTNVVFFLTLGDTCSLDSKQWHEDVVEICGRGLYCDTQYDGTSACVHVPGSTDHDGAPVTVEFEGLTITRPVKYLNEGYHCVDESHQMDIDHFPFLLRCDKGLLCSMRGICELEETVHGIVPPNFNDVQPHERTTILLKQGNYCVNESQQGDVRAFPQMWKCDDGLVCQHGICEAVKNINWVPTTPDQVTDAIATNQTARQGEENQQTQQAQQPISQVQHTYAEPAVVIHDLSEGESCTPDHQRAVFMNGRLHKCVIGLICAEDAHACSQPKVTDNAARVVAVDNQQDPSVMVGENDL